MKTSMKSKLIDRSLPFPIMKKLKMSQLRGESFLMMKYLFSI